MSEHGRPYETRNPRWAKSRCESSAQLSARPGETPVFANTGVNLDNVKDTLALASGVIIGTHFKVDGITWNSVDGARVKRFMDKVNTLR